MERWCLECNGLRASTAFLTSAAGQPNSLSERVAVTPASSTLGHPLPCRYMVRLGLWGLGGSAFPTFAKFLEAVQVGARTAGSEFEGFVL